MGPEAYRNCPSPRQTPYNGRFPNPNPDPSMPSEAAKTRIRDAFDRLKTALPGFRDRKVQRWMIAEVAKTFAADDSEPNILALEAGTGTGKSLGYLIPGIAVAQEEKKTLVVATGTVALQEQLLQKDLPLVARHAGMDFRSQLAKGRGRYACIRDLERATTDDGGSDQLALEDAVWAQPPSEEDAAAVRALHEAWTAERWHGDLDAWPEPLSPRVRSLVTTTRHGCTGSACPQREHCPYYRDRDRVWGADVVVTNHNLVLADLALGGGAVLPAPSECLYVFDEGHHLPDRAVDQFHAASGCEAARSWVPELAKGPTELVTALPDDNRLGDLANAIRDQAEAMDTLLQEAHATIAANWTGDEGAGEWRFPRGEVDPTMRELAQRVAGPARQLAAQIQEVGSKGEKALEEAKNRKDTATEELLGKILPRLGMDQERCENLTAAWGGFAEPDAPDRPPLARWIEAVPAERGRWDYRVAVSPISAADELQQGLWAKCAGALITSATLTSLGRFDRLLGKLGLTEGEQARCFRLPSPFDYQQAVLRVPKDRLPDPRESEEHTRAVAALLPETLAPTQGSLVLFTSRRQMEAVYERLPGDWQKRTRCQGSASREQLLADHEAAINAGHGSVLFGLASFAEGMDLPGALCRHVVIARLPFSVPTTPVEATTHEWVEAQGGKPFFEISLPDASLRLIQAVGRLIRTEDDWGTITILDPRVVTKGYGRDLLDSLPPIPREVG